MTNRGAVYMRIIVKSGCFTQYIQGNTTESDSDWKNFTQWQKDLKSEKQIVDHTLSCKSVLLKGIVSRDFGGLQMIIMDRAKVHDIPLKVYFLLFYFLYCFFSFKLSVGKAFFINALSKSLVSGWGYFIFRSE